MPLVVSQNVRQSMISEREASRLDNIDRDPLEKAEATEGDRKPRFVKKKTFGLRKSISRFLRTQVSEDSANKIFERGVFLPNSNQKLGWDVFLCILIVYSVISVTTRIGFDLEVDIDGKDAIVDYTIDTLFALDILINFFTGFYDDDMVLVSNKSAIGKRYLKLWFWIDVGATIPFDALVEVATKQDGGQYQTLRLLRFFRLLKLGRLRKLGQAISNLEDLIGIHPTVIELWRLLAKIMFLSHFVACGWHYISSQSDDVGIFKRRGLENEPYMTRYLMSLHWALATMTGVGYGDIYAVTVPERVYAIFVQIMGASIFGFLLGNINTILDSINLRSSFRRRKMNQVKHYMKQMELPKDLRHQVKRHFRHLCQKKEIFAVESALGSLSSSLYKEVVLQTFYQMRLRFPLLMQNTPEFLMGCVTSMLPVAYYAGEEITLVGDIVSEIHFLFEGMIHYVGEKAWMGREETGFFEALQGYERSPSTANDEVKAKRAARENNIVDNLDNGTVIGIYTDGALLFTEVLEKETTEKFSTKAASFCDCYIIEKHKFGHLLDRYGIDKHEIINTARNRSKKLAECVQLRSLVMRYSTEGELTIVRMSDSVFVNDRLTFSKDLGGSGYHPVIPEKNRKHRQTKMSMFRQVKGLRRSIIKKSNAVHPNRGMAGSRKRGPRPNVVPSETRTISTFVINHEGTFKLRWEMVLCVLILYSAITVPYLLAFEDEAIYMSFFWYLEIFVDIFFVTDLVLNFFTSYIDNSNLRGRTRVRDILKIAEHYLMSKWFPIDFFSSIPFDRILRLYFKSANRFKSLRLIRMLRLTRLMKLFKKSAYLEDLEDENPTLMQASKLLLQVSFSAHFLACAWYFVSVKGKTTCSPQSVESGIFNPDFCNWTVLEKDNSGNSKIETYLASLYWAYTTMTTVGYGDIVPGSESEAVMAVFGMIFGVTMFAYVVGSMAVVVTSLNATTRRVKQKIDDFDMFLREKDIEPALHKRVKDYYGYYLRSLYKFDEEYLLVDMPYSLRKKCLFHTYGKQLKSIPFFYDWDEFGISQFAPRMKNQHFEQGETICAEGDVGTHLFFIEKGQVDVFSNQVHLTTMGVGQLFGDVSALFRIPMTATVRAATNVKVFSVSGQNFRSVLKSFHDSNNTTMDVAVLLESMLNKVAQMTFTAEVQTQINETLGLVEKKGAYDVLLNRTRNNRLGSISEI